MYKLLSLAFAMPNGELRQAIESAGSAVEKLENKSIKKAYKELEKHLHSLPDAEAYVNTFDIGEKKGALYETAYLRKENPLHSDIGQRVLADISGFYRAFGVKICVGEKADHIAAELEFMHLLLLKELAAPDKEKAKICRDAQKKFLREHILRWSPMLAGEISACGGFYTSAAELLKAFIESEKRVMKDA